MTGGDLLQVAVVVAVADDAAAADAGGYQRATADGRPEPADDAAAASSAAAASYTAADQLRLVVVRSGRGRRVGHHGHAARAHASDAGHRRLEVASASEHHLVAGQVVLACDHRVPERYCAGFVQHVYVGLHVVAVDRFGRAGVQVGRRAADHLLASVAHSRGTPATGHAIFLFGRPIPLPAVLEPVGHLRRGQSGGFGQFPLLPGARVRVAGVPFAQHHPGLFLETVAGLLAVPDGPGQRELAADPVLADGAQRAAPELLGLHVVRLEPEGLQLGVVVRGELVALQQPVQLLEVAAVERHDGLGLEHALVLVQLVATGQRPQEPAQPLDVAGLLEHLAHARHLFLGEPERRQQRRHGATAAAAAASGARAAAAARRRTGRMLLGLAGGARVVRRSLQAADDGGPARMVHVETAEVARGTAADQHHCCASTRRLSDSTTAWHRLDA